MPIQRRGMRALQIWCQRVTSDYANVDVTDLTSSFRDGLAFCAIIHHFRPELIPNFADLKPENVLENNALAFRVAEEKLDVPALLDPEDMVDADEPDKFSVVTYVSQFYHLFKDEDGSRNGSSNTPAKTVVKHVLSGGSESENDSLIHSSSSESTPMGTPKSGRMVFNQADLIAKYGEEIFSSSVSKESSGKKTTNSFGSSLSRDFMAKAKISEEKES